VSGSLNAPLIFGVSVIVLFGALGWRDGLVKRVLEVAGAVASLLLTAHFAGAVQPWVSARTGAATAPALLITWAVMFLLGLILSRLLTTGICKLLHPSMLAWIDRLGGVLLGLAFGVLVASVLLVAASQIRGGAVVQADCDRSFAGRTMFYAAPNVYIQARKLSGGRVEEAWSRFVARAAEAAAAGKARVEEATGHRSGS
jgi:uncharacterized membrane protein required for colicin V production